MGEGGFPERDGLVGFDKERVFIGNFIDICVGNFIGKGTPRGKKMFSFGHCPNEGGERALPELKNTL